VNRRSFLSRSAAATTIFMGTGFKSVLARAAKASTSGSPAVEMTAGKIRGSLENKIYAFKGVPYGASTAGNMRFMPPAKTQAWTGVRDAFEIGLRCPQLPGNLVPEFAVMDRTEPSGEDCLRLNLWTQGLKDGHKRPVMVWLHGGGFTAGSAGFTCYDGTNIAAKHDVVLVGVNHRLNIFGFLYLADIGGDQFAQSSNVGMMDIVAALEWVRDNIANFGGDPGNVTIFGQSGGGSKVSTLLGMPAANGLFHRAIAMSGSAAAGVTRGEASESAETVLKRLNLDKNRIAELQAVPMRQLLALTRFGPQPGLGTGVAGGPPLRLQPVTDGRTLPAVPFDPVATQISADIPLMISSTETEITWNAQQSYDPMSDDELRGAVRQTLRTDEAGAGKVIGVYKKNRPMASNLDIFLILGSDASNFRTGTDIEAERKAALAKAPVYKAYFQWYSPVRAGMLRSMHTMDIPFVMENVDIARTELGDGKERYALQDRMSTAFVTFARTGNPNHKGIPNWSPYTPVQRATMIWNNECRVVNDPYREEKDAIAAVQGRNRAAS